ncbi:hypothetical protein GCM10023206_11920 [Acinetobacter puyangensis]|uniref:DUF2281 domain-containing protein n=1 Tax=Acinetobacter puyangensis TaxID=1096779 RepID=A0A240EAC0_9GAMM|nr:DUF2281 domain-containing protein [Acinetobacter puyangensis]SNX45496.1 Protein of unknown function [Acinetobacter puyangensis]
MSIAQAIFLQVQNLPEDQAKEVLDFANFLAQKSTSAETNHKGKRKSNLLKNKVKIIDEDWHKPNYTIEEDFYQ